MTHIIVVKIITASTQHTHWSQASTPSIVIIIIMVLAIGVLIQSDPLQEETCGDDKMFVYYLGCGDNFTGECIYSNPSNCIH